MRVIHFSDATQRLHQVINQVVNDCDVTIIYCEGGEAAVFISKNKYSSIMETLHLLKSPANVKHLDRSLSQYRKGQIK
ncbi:MAG: prevent-host-death protein [Polynucleobacter sp. GWA2_45_21]|nr:MULTISPECIES: type II toxin-antitoxin system Phd/YefM family antitoxin [unclassified Polynucleobacter]OHC08888.1 MAG: prevent-host-death protein [Polynucleobacter sp. GWA2_45_21]HBK43318.1 type II toxin-antitoxin system prevent-host-death family antitoxin [Polynucleobacter sp.]